MRKEIVSFTFLIGLFVIVMWGCWGVNLWKLTQCDFEAPYKCEVTHGVGLYPPAEMFTLWIDTGE